MMQSAIWLNTRRTGVIFAQLLVAFTVLTQASAQTFTDIHDFSGTDGVRPVAGLVMDRAGDFYGTASYGGSQNCGDGCGVVYELRPAGSTWIISVLYSFQGGNDGAHPIGGVTFGPGGNL